MRLPTVPGFSIQSAYAENPDPLLLRRFHGLHSQLAAFWFQGSPGSKNLAHLPRKLTWCHHHSRTIKTRLPGPNHLPDTLPEFLSLRRTLSDHSLQIQSHGNSL
ncbi:hypothetical protein AMECASPLE_027068 [Ameca splendens]|uniref:Uncharacterized protein n=1 Tax=Ameca splendens TaxID=208324 RepID=A0ABV0YGK9_9TELE